MLQITPRVCYSRPPTEAPQTDVFAQVDEIDEKKEQKRIFSGWMFADSPGLHGIEHPIYDIWLKDCKGGTTVIHEAPTVEASAPNPDETPPTDTGVDATATTEQPAPPPRRRESRSRRRPWSRRRMRSRSSRSTPRRPSRRRQRPGAVNWPTTGLATATRGVPLGFTQKQGTLACPEAFRSR